MWVQRNLLLCALAALAAAAPVAADEKGEAALREAFKTLHAAKTYTADITVNVTGTPQPISFTGTVAAMKPNFLRVELKGPSTMLFVADGKDYYVVNGARYQKMPLAAAPTEFSGRWEGEIDAFFGGEKGLAGREISSVGTETVGGVESDLVKVAGREGGPSVVYAIGKKDHLIRRAAISFTRPEGPSITQTNTLTAIRLDAPKQAKEFTFTPPAGARLQEMPNFEARLVPVGNDAPAFVLATPGGGTIALRDALRGKKAVLVNFWFYG